MKLSNGRPSLFRKSKDERGERLKSVMSPRLANGSLPRSDSVSPPNASDEGSCWEAAVTVDDVDAGDDKPTSTVDFGVREGCWSVGRGGDETREGSALGFAGLLPVTGLHTPELSSGNRKTSIGPRVLFRDTW